MSDSESSPPLVLIGLSPEEESFIERKMRAEKEFEKEFEEKMRLESAWAIVSDWNATDTEEQRFKLALRLCDLVQHLKERGLADRLEELEAGTNPKQYARHIYRLARDRKNAKSIAAQLRELQYLAEHGERRKREEWEQFGRAVWGWLRHGLMREILRISPESKRSNDWERLNAAMLVEFDEASEEADSGEGPTDRGAEASPERVGPKLTLKQANEEAMKLAKEDPRFVHKTQREWAEEIGCAYGQISRLPFWREVANRTGRARKPKRPPVVALTEKVLATTSDRDAELNRLLAEQKADEEASPIVDDPPGKPIRIKVRKKL